MGQSPTFIAETRSRAWACVWACGVAISIHGWLDFTMAAQQVGLPGLAWLRGMVVVLGLGLPLGVLLGGFLALALAAGRRPDETLEVPALPGMNQVLAMAVAVFIAASLSAGALLFTIHAFHRASLMALATTLVTMGGLLVAAVGYRVVRRMGRSRTVAGPTRWRRIGWTLAALGWTVALMILDGFVAGPSGPSLRGVLLLPMVGLIGMAAFALADRLARARWPVWTFLAITVAAPLVALSPVGDEPALRLEVWNESDFLPRVESLWMPLLDGDGDGALAVLGGGDCDDGSARAAPGRIEVAGNGLDDDCLFGDLRPSPDVPAAPAPAASELAVLVTVSGLDGYDGRLSPTLPELEGYLRERARRYTRPVGVLGRYMHVAPVLITGRVPLAVYPGISGFPPGGPTLPAQLARAGGKSHLSMPKRRFAEGLRTHAQISDRDAEREAETPRQVVDGALELLGRRGSGARFLWVHLDLGPAKATPGVHANRVDRALVRLVRALEERPGGRASYRVLLVGLAGQSGDRDGREPVSGVEPARARGGPIALLGPDVPAGEVADWVGLFDVRPTLEDMLGLGPERDWPYELPPAPGKSLLRDIDAQGGQGGQGQALPWTRYALTGRFADGVHLGVIGPGGVVEYQVASRRFSFVGQDLRHGYMAHDAEADEPWLVHALSLLRDRVLGPRQRAKNRLLARAWNTELPDDIHHTPDVVIGDALHIVGYTLDHRIGRQLVVTLYMRGGEHLRPDDLLVYRVNWNEDAVVPGHGAMPFGSWIPGSVQAHTIVVDGRSLLHATSAGLQVGVRRDGELLPITGGPGHSGWAHLSSVDLSGAQ